MHFIVSKALQQLNGAFCGALPYCYLKYMDTRKGCKFTFRSPCMFVCAGAWVPTCVRTWILDLWMDPKLLALSLLLPLSTELYIQIESEKLINTVSSFIETPSWLITCFLPRFSIILKTNWYNLQLKLLLGGLLLF